MAELKFINGHILINQEDISNKTIVYMGTCLEEHS